MSTWSSVSIGALVSLVLTSSAFAQERRVASRDTSLDVPPVVTTDLGPDAVHPEPTPKPKAEPYPSLFMMGSPTPGTGVKADATLATFSKDGNPGLASVFLVSGGYKITDSFGVRLRLGVDRVAVDGADTKVGFLNPDIGAVYAWRLGRWLRLGVGLTLRLPLGSGGGNDGDPDLVAAHKSASLARSSMEGSMYSVNDFSTGYTVNFAYVGHGLTAQAQSSIFTSFRARGDEVQSDTFKASWTQYVGLGYFIIPALSIGTELRYQRYVSTPSSVEKDPSARQNLTVAGGLRAHFKVSDSVSIKPGASYAHGLVGPVSTGDYNMFELDLPVSF